MTGTKAFPNLRQVEAAGLQTVSESQLMNVSLELQLREVARQVAAQYLKCCPQAIRDIAESAPIRALGQAVCRFGKGQFEGDLGDYLVNATGSWAALLAGRHLHDGSPIPAYRLEQALKEEVELMATCAVLDNASAESLNVSKPEGALSRIERALQDGGLQSNRVGNQLHFGVLAGTVGCDCMALANSNAISLYAYSPIFVPTHRRAAVSEALAIANWNLLFGAFEMDPADGQVRFRNTLPLIGDLIDEHAHMLIGTTINAMKRYAGALCELALTDSDPKLLMARLSESGSTTAAARV